VVQLSSSSQLIAVKVHPFAGSHESVVHLSPSLHGAIGMLEQDPLFTSQIPVWQASIGGQLIGSKLQL